MPFFLSFTSFAENVNCNIERGYLLIDAHSSCSDLCWRYTAVISLILVWCAGLSFGLTSAYAASNSLPSLMCQVIVSPVSIVSMLLRTAFFFLITYFAFVYSESWLVLPACFVRAFLFSFYLKSVFITFGNVSWLVLIFTSLCNCFSIIALLWLWIRHISVFRTSLHKDVCLCLIVHFLCGILELYIFSPNMALIMK